MDGTATGILGLLAVLERPCTSIDAEKDTGPMQYLISARRVRNFFVSFFTAAKSRPLLGFFDISTPALATRQAIARILADERDEASRSARGLDLQMLFGILFQGGDWK